MNGAAASALELCRTVASFYLRGWCLGTAGNYSLCLGRGPLRLLITPSGADKGALRPEMLLTVDEAGNVLAGEGQPSAETLLHTTIAARLGAGAILHTHSVAGTLLSEHHLERGSVRIAGYEMLKGLPGVSTHETAVEVPVLANAQDMVPLAAELASLIECTPAQQRSTLPGFLLAGHGLYTWGATLADARRQVECLEFLFECVARRTAFAPLPAGGPAA